jgi:cellobiose transport system permease protein
VLPALRPAAAVLAIFTFMQTWNDFMWPLVALQDPTNPTVQISLRSLGTGYYTDYAQVFAGTAVAVVPLLVVFIVFGRQIIGGIMEGALKA